MLHAAKGSVEPMHPQSTQQHERATVIEGEMSRYASSSEASGEYSVV